MALRFDEDQDLARLSHGEPPRAWLVMDGQWGSCGKGLLCGKLALEREPDVAVCNFGPNAGHTFEFPDGRRIMTQQLPTALVHRPALLLIGPGAIVDPEVLAREIDALDGEFDISRRLMVHERAAVVSQSDRDAEAKLVAISSTRKGAGAAQAKKMMRVGEPGQALVAGQSERLREIATVVTDAQYRDVLRNASKIQIESAQGFELSLNHGSHYPYCTSRDATPESILNEVGVPLHWLSQTCVVVRTLPIRVGDEVGEGGEVLGVSGPVHADMRELDWDEVSKRAGMPVMERTTVTGKVRRIFTWSDSQFERMLERMGPCEVMLNYANYLNPGADSPAGLAPESEAFVDKVAAAAERFGSRLSWVGYGPAHQQVHDHATGLGSVMDLSDAGRPPAARRPKP